MPLAEKDALEVLGFADLSKFDDADSFKEAVEKDWVKKSTAGNDKEVRDQVLGKVNRVARKRLGELASELGVELDAAILDSGDPVDIVPLITKGAKGKFGDIEELRKKAESALPADTIKVWEDKLGEAEKKVKTFQSAATDWQKKHDDLLQTVQTKERTSKIEAVWKEALGGVQFHQGVDDLKRKGFVADLKDRFRIEMDENGNPYTADTAGQPVKHPKKASELWSLAEIVKEEAKKNKLTADSPHAGKVVDTKPRTIAFGQQPPAQDPDKGRYVAKPVWVK